MTWLLNLPWQWWMLAGILIGGLYFVGWCLVRVGDDPNEDLKDDLSN